MLIGQVSCAEPTHPQFDPFQRNPTVRSLLMTVVVGSATPLAVKLAPQVIALAVPLSVYY
jgi:dihydroorotate dehydrogenase